MTTPHVVVVGSGIAGLTAAHHAAAAGARVTLVTKASLAESNTRYAQGGVAAVMFDDDRVADHVRDTLMAGAGLGDPAAVRVLASEGPARIRELVAAGVAFDRTADGAFVRGLEAAHSYPRVLHAGGDATGAVIEAGLIARLRTDGVEIVEGALLTELLTDGGRCVGVELLVAGALRTVRADAVVLATGGAGQLYAHTTNPAVATGDGIAAALRAGAEVADLEFVQFHPTVLAAGDAFLVSEAMRGEGAVLRDARGHRFMVDVHPDAELAPRDVVARAIVTAMAAQDGRPVLLDATGLRATPAATADFLAERFPTIDAAVRARGLDWAREPIPVTPAAHYLMGGVVTDLDGRTSIPGLFAAGEVARTGVHGANRLASNSLLEGAVFGARAGRAAASAPASAPAPGLPVREGSQHAAPAADASRVATPRAPMRRAELQQLMWECAGVERDAAGLAHAARVLDGRAMPEPTDAAAREDANLLVVARAVVAAALARTESVGAHFRRDAAASSTTPEIHAVSPLENASGRRDRADLRSSEQQEVA
ncbi:L-aspartate oxidase [Microbacterium telephonicum]|uniref:L-aspartate oxidase n=1 Tax=Microbacterium telephonicum TaxID=1714841 RepID=A0A498C990_9MICO|nr:L-aspartate oxidase [Microbacterium telephonicum]RLK49058.1 L-aspartate oxidase [Microbacterium telephonicum]